MTNATPDREEDAGPARICGVCTHPEADHADHEEEVAGDTIRRGYCNVCEEWHDFVAASEA